MPVYVMAFESTHAAMAAGKALERAGIAHLTIPTPRAISAGCGIALKFESDDPHGVFALAVEAAGNPDLASLFKQESAQAFTRMPAGS